MLMLIRILLIAGLLTTVQSCSLLGFPNHKVEDLNVKEELGSNQLDAQEMQELESQMLEELDQDAVNIDQMLDATMIRFNVSASNLNAKLFFKDLAQTTNSNILVSPDVDSNINLHLNNVTLKETLIAIRDSLGLDFKETTYGYQILSNEVQSKMFRVNYLNINRIGSSDTSISSGQISGQGGGQSSQVATEHSSNFWQSLKATLELMIGDQEDRSVVVNAQAGLVVVKASPTEIQAVESFLDQAELTMQKQVIIEAKILEIQLNENFDAGINWNTFANDASNIATSNLTGSFGGATVSSAAGIGGIFNINVNSGDFSGLIQILEHQGEVQVLSSPRISTVNNQKAVIKVGTDEYFVTEATPQASGGTGDASSSDAAPAISLTPFFSGIALDVTPQINQHNSVILHVRPSVTEITERYKNITLGDTQYDLPLAYSSIRETDSVIKAQSGQIVIIGGLLQNKQSTSDTGVPFLGKLPIFGHLFNQKRDSRSKSELVILLKPLVTDQQYWQQELDETFSLIEQ